MLGPQDAAGSLIHYHRMFYHLSLGANTAGGKNSEVNGNILVFCCFLANINTFKVSTVRDHMKREVQDI